MLHDARAQLRAAAAASGRSLSYLSVLIGREPGFLPTFVETGEPAQLDALDRRHLAIYLGFDDQRLPVCDTVARTSVAAHG